MPMPEFKRTLVESTHESRVLYYQKKHLVMINWLNKWVLMGNLFNI